MRFLSASDARRKAPHDHELIAALEQRPSLGWIDEPYEDLDTGELSVPMRSVPLGISSAVLGRIEKLAGQGDPPPAPARHAGGALTGPRREAS